MDQAKYESDQAVLVDRLRNKVFELDFRNHPDRSFACVGDVEDIAREILELPSKE